MTQKETNQLILEAIRWIVVNHVTPHGKYWQKDYSSLAYTDDKIVKEFFKQREKTS